MATQTPTQRRAAANKAAATRKRNATKRSASATKSSARQTRRSATDTARSARQTTKQATRTTKQATRTTARGFGVAGERLDELGRRAQRAVYIQIGAAASARDALTRTAQRYSSIDRVVRELNKFERRGARAVNASQRAWSRRRRTVEHDVRGAQRDLGRQANGLKSDASDVIARVKRLA